MTLCRNYCSMANHFLNQAVILMIWQQLNFLQLDVNTLYEIIKLRIDVFVVEQCCYYPELDDLDRHPQTIHLFGYDEQQRLAAYLRCLPPAIPNYLVANNHHTAIIGRVVVAPFHRGSGLGHELMTRGIQVCRQNWQKSPIKIAAQAHLQHFYAQHGFCAYGSQYLEDNIPHINMQLSATEFEPQTENS